MKFKLSSPDSMLLSREIFKNRQNQLVVSFLMFTVLGIQILLFFQINSLIEIINNNI